MLYDGHVMVGARFGTTAVRRVTPGRASTASAGEIPIPPVGTLKAASAADVPDNTALFGFSKSTFKETARETHGSPALREPLTDDAGMTVE